MLDAATDAEACLVAVPTEVAEDPILKPCGCKKPSVQTMDYKKHSPDDWDHPELRINRACLRCWAHWFGPPDSVKFFTSKQWDAYIGAASTVSEVP